MALSNDTPEPPKPLMAGCQQERCSRSSKLWDVKHPYYCNEGNYYAKGNEQPHCHYKTWGEFMGGYGNSDMDYNFLIRWDWDEEEERAYTGDDYYRNGVLKVFWMGQRKGLYQWSTVEVCRADEPAVREFLQTRWDYMRMMWEPFSCERFCSDTERGRENINEGIKSMSEENVSNAATPRSVDQQQACSDLPVTIERIVAEMRKLSDDERMEIMSNFCRHCGCDNPRCQCWNDE